VTAAWVAPKGASRPRWRPKPLLQGRRIVSRGA